MLCIKKKRADFSRIWAIFKKTSANVMFIDLETCLSRKLVINTKCKHDRRSFN